VFRVLFLGILFLSTGASASEVSVQKLISSEKFGNGFYKVEDTANDNVIYIYKNDGDYSIKMIKNAKKAWNQPVLPENNYVKSADQRIEKITNLLRKGNDFRAGGDGRNAQNQYEEAMQIIKTYKKEPKQRFKISVRDVN
jgi:predicted translin family RNA/ssDNA-binding protein